ncbi:hypothetical protein BJ912DRAFT_929112 [Pholiota molesta]|nr:hypothetical protein BJ912DRAFT_929112 [Pholiota molesta]
MAVHLFENHQKIQRRTYDGIKVFARAEAKGRRERKKTVDAVKDEKSMIGECGNAVPANRVPRRAGWEVQVSGPLADTIPLHDNDHLRRARVQALRPANAPLRIQADAEQCATHGEDAIEDTMAFRNEVPAQKLTDAAIKYEVFPVASQFKYAPRWTFARRTAFDNLINMSAIILKATQLAISWSVAALTEPASKPIAMIFQVIIMHDPSKPLCLSVVLTRYVGFGKKLPDHLHISNKSLELSKIHYVTGIPKHAYQNGALATDKANRKRVNNAAKQGFWVPTVPSNFTTV